MLYTAYVLDTSELSLEMMRVRGHGPFNVGLGHMSGFFHKTLGSLEGLGLELFDFGFGIPGVVDLERCFGVGVDSGGGDGESDLLLAL
jgi:hypothetical protein